MLFRRYDLSEFEGVSVLNLTFGDIKDAVVDKFCVEECAGFYQDEFLGCCTASMVQDEGINKVLQSNQHIFQNLFSYSD